MDEQCSLDDYMTESVNEYVFQKYKGFDGKTLVSFIEEGFILFKDEEERKDEKEHKMEQMKKPPHLVFDNFNIYVDQMLITGYGKNGSWKKIS